MIMFSNSTTTNLNLFKNDGYNFNNLSLEGNTNYLFLKPVDYSENPSSFLDYHNIFSLYSSEDEISREDLYLNIKIKSKKESENKNKTTEDKETETKKETKIIKEAQKEKNIPKFLTRKKGRPISGQEKKVNEGRYIHGKQGTDNMIRKIQVHFFTFIVKYVNYYIKNYFSNKQPLFTDLEYSYKINIKKSFFNELKTKTIGDILKNKGSIKNKKGPKLLEPSNQEVFNLIYNKDNRIKKLLDTKYLEFFCKVYAYSLFYEEKKEKIKGIQRPVIPKGLETFDELLKKEEKSENKNDNNNSDSNNKDGLEKSYIMRLKEICKLRYN